VAVKLGEHEVNDISLEETFRSTEEFLQHFKKVLVVSVKPY
jgi:hypothetical protein